MVQLKQGSEEELCSILKTRSPLCACKHTHVWENGAEFGSDLAQPAAPPRPSSESSPDDSQTQQPLGSSALLCKGKWLSEGNKVIEKRTGLSTKTAEKDFCLWLLSKVCCSTHFFR